jgi:hypothetical protein
MKRQTLLLAGICSLAFTLNTSAAVLYVDLNSTNPLPPYAGWSTAATNIQDAVEAAHTGDQILVTNGIYQTFGRFLPDPTSRVVINKAVTVQSVNGPAVTVIQGYQDPGTTNGPSAVRCVYLSNGSTLSGFTLTNGATQNYSSGGGVYCQSTNCVVTNCVIVGNSAYGSGGGAYSGTLVNCVLAGNTANKLNIGNGGGAYNSVLVNCLLTGNQSGYVGGAASWCTLVNCTVVSNSAAAYNGSLSACTAKNSIVYYNFSYYTNVDINSGSYFTNCCTSFAVTFGGANNFTNPPLFANLSAGDFHLNAASSCINAGNNSYIAISTDLDGNPRIFGGTVDLGAYEFQSPVRFVSVSNTAPVSPFTNWVTAAMNIQDAIDVANAGDFIVVSNGTYNTGGRAVYGTATNRVTVDKAITLESVNGAALTIIVGAYTAPTYGGPNIRCAYLTNGAILSGFTLTNGGTPPVLGDLIREASGGGVWCEDGSAVVSNCVLVGNVSGYGGGGAYSGTLVRCTISSNAVLGGRGWGGGAWSSTLKNCILSYNTGYEGGGANLCKLNNCLITRNSASFGGGAFASTLNNCTIAKNSSTYSGGGIEGGTADTFSTNCVVYYNTAPSGSNWSGGNLANCCTVPLPTGGGNITNAPLFVNLAADNFHLQTNSPCINSGNNASAPGGTDLDGNPRIAGGTVDIGAYEYQTPTSVISYAWLQQYGLTNNGTADYTDSDGDGMNNWQEWKAGTIPTNAASVLQLASPSNSVSGMIVTWQSVSGITYFLQRSTNLSAQPAFSTIQSNIIGQTGTTSYLDTTAAGHDLSIYRVGVQ